VVSPSTVHAYPLSYRGRQHEALVIDEPAGFTIHRFIDDSQRAYWVSHFVQQSPALNQGPFSRLSGTATPVQRASFFA